MAKGREVEILVLGESIRGHVLPKTFLAAKKDLFPLIGDGVGLLLGNITAANGVLDHLLPSFFRAAFFPERRKGPLYNPVQNAKKNEKQDETAHIASVRSGRGTTFPSSLSSANIWETVLRSRGWTQSGAIS